MADENQELLPPRGMAVPPSRFTPRQKQVAIAVSGAILFTIFLWAISQFFQVRGVIHLMTSRIFLGIAWLMAALFVLGTLRAAGTKGWKLRGVFLALLLLAAAIAMDRLYPMPKPAQPAAEQVSHEDAAVLPIPHLQARLVIDTVRSADLDFHIEVENISLLEVQELRGNMRTGVMTEMDVAMPLAPVLPAGGHISIPGMPASGLKKYGNLFVDLNYDSIRAGTRDTFTSSYAFMVRPSDMRLQSLLPTTWQEKTGAILGPERDTMERALKTLAGSTGTMMFAVPLRRPDGTPNFIVITNDKREFVFDVGLRLMSFTTTPKRGERKTIKYDLPVSSAEAIVIACAWDDLKDEAKLYVDGKEVP